MSPYIGRAPSLTIGTTMTQMCIAWVVGQGLSRRHNRVLICGSGALDRKTTEPHFVRSVEGMCIVVIKDRAAFNMTICEGRPNPNLHIVRNLHRRRIRSRPAHDLPPDIRRIMEAHFFDGESIFKLRRRYKLKRWDLEGRCRHLFMDASTMLGS
jgi:hypothetical protein